MFTLIYFGIMILKAFQDKEEKDLNRTKKGLDRMDYLLSLSKLLSTKNKTLDRVKVPKRVTDIQFIKKWP